MIGSFLMLIFIHKDPEFPRMFEALRDKASDNERLRNFQLRDQQQNEEEHPERMQTFLRGTDSYIKNNAALCFVVNHADTVPWYADT